MAKSSASAAAIPEQRIRQPKAARVTKTESKQPITIIQACQDPELFGGWFRDRESWVAWLTFLKVMFGLALNDAELAIFQQHTGRSAPAPGGYFDVSLVVGRRGGKSLILAATAAFLACFLDWHPFLTGGERGTVAIIAADRRQAGVIFKYLREMLAIALFEGLIERETNELLELKNGITIEVQTASYRTIRGRTVVAALCDELAFWRNDETGSNPDSEIVAALRPAMATVKGARLLKASSPYARKGVLWDDFNRFYGDDNAETLVWRASSKQMNPSIPDEFLEREFRADPARAEAEYNALFRTDVENFVSREVVEGCVIRGRYELPPMKHETYGAFVDPSGGSSDAMTLCIVHRENDRVIVDAIRETRPPFSPESVVAEYAELLKTYKISVVVGDRYAGLWPRERFEAHGVKYEPSERPKSDLYRDLLPLLNAGRVELLDHPKSINQICSLERRTSRGGRDLIDSPPKQHEDVANAIAGAVTLAVYAKRVPVLLFG
jgi:hypothetical protein